MSDKRGIHYHDRFVRSLMSHPEVAKEFFITQLPEEIREIVNLSTIELEKESFVGDVLDLQIADLLYSVDVQGSRGYLYLLVEHASTPDKLLPYRMAKYMFAIIDYHLKTIGGLACRSFGQSYYILERKDIRIQWTYLIYLKNIKI